MKTPIFKPEDFQSYTIELNEYAAAELANAKLQKLVESAPVVYSYNGKDDWFLADYKSPTIKYKCRVMFIEPLEVKECEEHVPKLLSKQPVGLPSCDDRYGAALILGCSIVCATCNKPLVAKWETVK